MTVRGITSPIGGQIQFDLLAAASVVTTQGVSTTVCDAGGYASLTAIVTCVTGSSSVFRLWLQGSYDGGASWFGLPMNYVSKTVVAALGLNETGTVITSSFVHSIINEAGAFTATTIFVSGVNSPPPLVRAAWYINAATPTQTFGVSCILSMMPVI
jgi:hypothetical protein